MARLSHRINGWAEVCILALLASITGSAVGDVLISSGNTDWSINPDSLALTVKADSGTTVVVSEGLWENGATASDIETAKASWKLGALQVECAPTTAGGGLEVTFKTKLPQSLSWPVVPLNDESLQIVWPKGEGLVFSAGNEFFRKEILAQEWDAVESLSLPLFGVIGDRQTISWFSTAPFRNTLHFPSTSESLSLAVVQEFSEKAPVQEVTYIFHVDDGADDPTVPARHYRDYLVASGKLRTLAEKGRETTSVELLRGAAHAYLWGDDPISVHDIPRAQWKPFCRALVQDAKTSGTPGSVLKGYFTADQWAAVEEGAKAEWPYDYLKRQIVDGLSTALNNRNFHFEFSSSMGREPITSGFQVGDPANVGDNGWLLKEKYPDFFLPQQQWGNGVSLKMLKAFSDAKLDRMKLCTPGHESLQLRPWVADEAKRREWLIGPYDSYHSVHSIHEKTDNTWSTAQMTEDIFAHGSVMKRDGSYYEGFRGVGRKTNSQSVRPYLEDRITSNMTDVDYNYYFMDCDATGEIYDDYDPLHLQSREQDAAERSRRLEWIAEKFNAVVGSEGGHAFAAHAIHVGEGVFGPFFGWDEPAMKDPESEFYRGRYYPPDSPDVFFKPVKLMDRFRKLFYDPVHRIPLYSTVFHDSVVVTHHWNNAHFKYPEVQDVVELTELLYLAPPMYHFNLDEFQKRKKSVMDFYKVWSPLHKTYGFEPLSDFRYLNDARTVQSTRFGKDCRIIVNFGSEDFASGDAMVPARSAYIVAPSLWKESRIYSPN